MSAYERLEKYASQITIDMMPPLAIDEMPATRVAKSAMPRF